MKPLRYEEAGGRAGQHHVVAQGVDRPVVAEVFVEAQREYRDVHCEQAAGVVGDHQGAARRERVQPADLTAVVELEERAQHAHRLLHQARVPFLRLGSVSHHWCSHILLGIGTCSSFRCYRPGGARRTWIVTIPDVSENAVTEEPAVLTERRGRILIVTINRPKAKNAVNAAVSQGLAAAMDELDGDAGLSVGIVTGAGGSFCAGMDLKAFARGENVVAEGRGLGFTERPPLKPLIAAVEGYALAGGTEVALATDLIVAANDSAFGIPEVKRGLVAGGGGLLRLPQRIPYQIAMELALTGENLSAVRAHELGLVNVLAEPGRALEAAIELAERITANGPLAVAATKRIITESRAWSPEEQWKQQMKILMPVFASKDAQEGAIAFAEKRAPNWTGS